MITAVYTFVPKWSFLTVATLLLLLNMAGCSTISLVADSGAPPYIGNKEAILPATVAETSGLACLDDGSFLTLNDSGHTASVYQINALGQVLQQFELNANNLDWEAMTIHQGELWVGDIGNNSGLRKGGDLYYRQLPLTQDKDANKLSTSQTSFIYPDLPLPPLQVYEHDFDAEALVSANGQLFLFNKAWQSDDTSVYLLEPNLTTTTARKVSRIDGLPGVVTDGAFSEQHQRFVLTGYAKFQKNVLKLALYNDYQPFLAVLDPNFQLLQVISFAEGGQLEAICIDAKQQVWLTQEQSKRRPALLWHWGSMQQLLSPDVNDQKTSQIK